MWCRSVLRILALVTDAASAILQTLAAAGVRTAFGLPGVHNLSFWAADGPLEIIGTRHEQTTVYAADGLARASGGLGVALTTTGPGAANAVAAFGEAAACGSPVLLVASDTSTAIARPGVVRGGLHESADQAALFQALAKAVHRPKTAQDAVDAVAQGAAQALQWPRGPVYVGIPTDLLGQDAEPRPIAPPERTTPDPADIAAAAELIAAAASVVIWAGGGVVQSGASEQVALLAARLGAPVIEGWAGRGAEHPWLVGLPPHEPEVTALLAAADLVIVIGTELDGPGTMNWKLPLPERRIAINADPVDAVKNYPPQLAIVADARQAVQALLDAVAQRSGDPAPVAALRERVRARLAADPDTADAWRFVSALDEAVAAHDPVVVCDMAIPGYWAAGYAAVTGPRRMQYPVGWGTLGYALPASIGPAVAGAGTVLAVCGDGGFMFAVGELAVVAEHELPVTVLLVDDGGYGMLRFDQTLAGAPHRGVDLGRPDFELLADAFGIPAARTDLDGLAETLDAALHAAAPRLVLLEAALHPPVTVSARWPQIKEVR
jgi:thiamine pyrophosphate-dependent acetolactate synthase large subunit-like protein